MELNINGNVTSRVPGQTLATMGPGRVNIASVISDQFADLKKDSPGELRLAGLNQYTGWTYVIDGTLLIGNDAPAGREGALGNNATNGEAIVRTSWPGTDAEDNHIAILIDGPYTVGRYIKIGNYNPEGTTTLGGNTATLSEFSGEIEVSRHLLLTAANGGTVTFSGEVNDYEHPDSHIVYPGSITKIGKGTVIFQAANDYSGPTVVVEGTLKLDTDGSIRLSSSIEVAEPGTLDVSASTAGLNLRVGQTLLGTGTVRGEVTAEAGAAISPGGGPGMLNTGTITFDPGSRFVAELNGAVPGFGYDQLNVTGTVELGGADLEASLGYVPRRNDRFVIVNNDLDDVVTGRFTGLPDDAALEVDRFPFRIDYQGGDGNDVALIPDWTADVTGRYVFYNGSSFDGKDPAANDRDDLAIAADKRPLMPGRTASFANYTSYDRGINGIMVDIAGLADETSLDDRDFQFKVGNNDDPDTWAELLDSPSITFRPGEGADGADRVTILWEDNAIENQWLQIVVRATEENGLPLDDVFYFGNAIGESGNSRTDARVNAFDMLGARDNQRDWAPIDFPYDFNRDARVDAADMLIARNNPTHFLNALRLISVSDMAAAVKPGPAVVPEPGTPVMLAAAVIALLLACFKSGRDRKRGQTPSVT